MLMFFALSEGLGLVHRQHHGFDCRLLLTDRYDMIGSLHIVRGYRVYSSPWCGADPLMNMETVRGAAPIMA